MREIPTTVATGALFPSEFPGPPEIAPLSAYADGQSEYSQAEPYADDDAHISPESAELGGNPQAAEVLANSDAPDEVPPITDQRGSVPPVPPTGTDRPREAAGDEPEPFGVARFDDYVPAPSELPIVQEVLTNSVESSLTRFDDYQEVGNRVSPAGTMREAIVLLEHKEGQEHTHLVVARRGDHHLIEASFVDLAAKEITSRLYVSFPEGYFFKADTTDNTLHRREQSILNLLDHGQTIRSPRTPSGAVEWKQVGAGEAAYVNRLTEQAVPRRFSLEALNLAVEDHRSGALELRQPTTQEIENSAMYARVFTRDVTRFLADRGYSGEPIVHTSEGIAGNRSATFTVVVQEAAGQDGEKPVPVVDVRSIATLTPKQKEELQERMNEQGINAGTAVDAFSQNRFVVGRNGVLIGIHREGIQLEGGWVKGNDFSYLGGAAVAKILRYFTRDEHPPLVG